MLKFGHSSDVHFGAGRRLTPKTTEYLDRHVAHLLRMLEIVVSKKLDFMLISGDIFENSGTTLEELLAAYEVFYKFGQVCPTIVTAGNHDELAVGEFQTKWLQLLRIPNVTFVSKPTSVSMKPLGTVLLGIKTPAVLAVPWTGIKDQKEFDEFIKKHYQGEPIVMLHECFQGSSTDTGYEAKGGVRVPDIEGVRYFACGDIHKYQRIGSLDHAWFSGAPCQYNFGDKPGKGFIVVEVHSAYDYRPSFVQIPSHIELHTVKDISEIPNSSPHWYKLVCPANKVPKHVPSGVKMIEPFAPKINIPEELFKSTVKDGKASPGLAIDYTDGVGELLKSAGYGDPDIQTVKQEINTVVGGA